VQVPLWFELATDGDEPVYMLDISEDAAKFVQARPPMKKSSSEETPII
jgi:hypothetical protein